MESRVPPLPEGYRYVTVVLAVPPIDHPDHELLSQILHHPWVRQFSTGNHLNQPGERPWN